MDVVWWFLGIFIATLIAYTSFYLLNKVSKPRLYHGNGIFTRHVLDHCPILGQYYWPTWWAVNRHVITVGRVLLQTKPYLVYKREIYTTLDGGQLTLNWCDPDHHDIKENSPILLILRGLTSTSQEIYVKWLVQDGLDQGYRPVVMSMRGLPEILMKTSKDYCANTDDLAPVIDHIHKSWPGLYIVALGVSLGGIILCQHLRDTGKNSGLKAVVTFSSPWDSLATAESLEKPINWLLYNRHLTNLTKQYVERHSKHLLNGRLITSDEGKMMLDRVRKCSSLREFDMAVSVPLLGFTDVTEYYSNGTNAGRIHKIATPLLSVTASNDPFVPEKSLPIDEFRANPNTLLAVVPHGGHFGFLEGWLPLKRTWMNRVSQEFLVAMKTYQ